uniref:Uncharacterized protein n=1 Tax=Triticum urartu TaxID=4572 RepID=A0A8R7NV40_TRIUA
MMYFSSKSSVALTISSNANLPSKFQTENRSLPSAVTLSCCFLLLRLSIIMTAIAATMLKPTTRTIGKSKPSVFRLW